MPVRFFNVSHFAKIYRPNKYKDTMKNMIKFNSANDTELVVTIRLKYADSYLQDISLCYFQAKNPVHNVTYL